MTTCLGKSLKWKNYLLKCRYLLDNRIYRVSKGSNKKFFALKLFEFCNLKNQQRFILEEEVSVSFRELAAVLNTLRQVLKQYDKTVKFPAFYPLPKPKQEIGFNLFKGELLAQYFQDIKEPCNRQVRFYCFESNKLCLSIKKAQIVGEQNVLTEIINLRFCEVHSLYNNHYNIASNCGIFDSNCDI